MKAKIAVPIIIILLLCAGVLIYEKERKEEKFLIEQEAAETDTAVGSASGADNLSDKEAADDTVFAYICGEVCEPGVYEIRAGGRIVDVLEAAGGFTDAAAADYVNLAEKVSDGMKIYVPSEEETENISPMQEADFGQSPEAGEKTVNINTADTEMLKTLPGIGDTKAKAIIVYREQSGGFETTEDIMKVNGIGQSTYDNIKELITVSG